MYTLSKLIALLSFVIVFGLITPVLGQTIAIPELPQSVYGQWADPAVSVLNIPSGTYRLKGSGVVNGDPKTLVLNRSNVTVVHWFDYSGYSFGQSRRLQPYPDNKHLCYVSNLPAHCSRQDDADTIPLASRRFNHCQYYTAYDGSPGHLPNHIGLGIF